MFVVLKIYSLMATEILIIILFILFLLAIDIMLIIQCMKLAARVEKLEDDKFLQQNWVDDADPMVVKQNVNDKGERI